MFSLAGNGGAREDLPHVLQRRAGGCDQGYLDGFQRGTREQEVHLASESSNKKNNFPSAHPARYTQMFFGSHQSFVCVMC